MARGNTKRGTKYSPIRAISLLSKGSNLTQVPMRINRKWKIGPVLPACVVFVFVGQRAIGLMLYITNESDKQSYTGIIY